MGSASEVVYYCVLWALKKLTCVNFSGAGNWYSPRDLVEGGTFVNTTDTASVPSSATPAELSNATSIVGTVRNEPIIGGGSGESRKMGRGGAGNFVWETEKERLSEEERKEREEAIQQSIQQDVEIGLAKPGRAVLKHETVKE